jgi:cell volume regulation protein A
MVLVQLIALPAGENHGLAIAGFLALQAIVGALVGVAGGIAASVALNRIDLPGGLHPLMVIAVAVLIYALAAVLEGSGFLAVYLAGMILGNRPLRAQASIVTVNDAVTWLSQIVMFMVLGLLVTPTRLLTYALPAVAIAVFLLLVGRPVAVWLCLTPFRFTTREKVLASWVGLRGAVSIFLAAIPTLSGVPHAELYFNVAFVVVLVSLLVQGWTLRLAARRLDLALPRMAGASHRSEIDVPGQFAVELVGYRVRPESAVVNGAAVPAWARPAFVVREQNIITPTQAGVLKSGDYAYFLAPPERASRLDQLFAPHAELLSGNEPFFGEFAFDGTVKLSEMAQFYGLTIGAAAPEATIATLFGEHFDGKPEVGDHLPLGEAVLVVREIEDDQVRRAGLQLDAISAPAVQSLLKRAMARIKRKRIRT